MPEGILALPLLEDTLAKALRELTGFGVYIWFESRTRCLSFWWQTCQATRRAARHEVVKHKCHGASWSPSLRILAARACRWFKESDVNVPEAAYLDLILYSREQLEKVSLHHDLWPSESVCLEGRSKHFLINRITVSAE